MGIAQIELHDLKEHITSNFNEVIEELKSNNNTINSSFLFLKVSSCHGL